MDSEASLAEQGQAAADFVSGLIEAFGAEADVSVEEVDDDTLEVRVEGDDLGLLIGPKGATLAAVQELTRTVVQRASGEGRGARIPVDVAGYRQRRREALERFAVSVAEQVRATGTPVAMEPMAAPDRKVVHDTINAIDGVATTSEGEEPRRRVVVVAGDGED